MREGPGTPDDLLGLKEGVEQSSLGVVRGPLCSARACRGFKSSKRSRKCNLSAIRSFLVWTINVKF